MHLSRTKEATTAKPSITADQLAPGLYWIEQYSPEKGVYHHAILDIGNQLGFRGINARQPALVHQTPPRVRRELFVGTKPWKILLRIEDQAGATERLKAALTNPVYHALMNNCEHFARYIATGTRESRQLQVVSMVGALLGLILVVRA